MVDGVSVVSMLLVVSVFISMLEFLRKLCWVSGRWFMFGILLVFLLM